MAVMWTTAGLTLVTTSAKDGDPDPMLAAASVPAGRGTAPPPPTRIPSRPATAATSANDRIKTGRGIDLTLLEYTEGSAWNAFFQEVPEPLFVDVRDPQLLGLVELGARIAPRDDVARLLGNRGCDPAPAGLDGRLGLVARHRLQAAREDELLARERVRALRVRRLLRADTRVFQTLEEPLVALGGEPIDDGLRDLGSDLVDRLDLFHAGLGDAVQASEMAGQQRGRAVAHEADGQPDQEAPQLTILAGFDPGQEVVRGLLRHALEADEVVAPVLQVVQVGEVLDQALLEELMDEDLAQPLDVHGLAPREVLEALLDLGRTGEVRATPIHLAFHLDDGRAADGAHRRRLPGLRVRRPLVRDDLDDLGDDVAALLDEDGVALAHVLARDLVFIEQARAGNGRARERDRFQQGDRRELARAPDVYADLADDGLGLARGVLERDGPARELRREAQLLLQGEGVDLHHHAVDVVLQGVALVLPLRDVGEDLVQAVAQARGRIGAQAPGAEALEGLPLAGRTRPTDVGDRIQEGVEPAPGHHLRVEGLHRAGGGVARVREDLLSGRLPLAIHGVEARAREVDLAADFQLVRHVGAVKAQGDRPDRAHVRGDIVAAYAVAAGDPAHQAALLVVQGHREPVDLELGHVVEGSLPHLAEDPPLELAQFLLGIGIVEAQHGHAVDELRELRGRRAAHALGGAVGRHQLRELALQRGKLAVDAVVFLVGDLCRALHVVEVVVPADLVAEGSDQLLGLVPVHECNLSGRAGRTRTAAMRLRPAAGRERFFGEFSPPWPLSRELISAARRCPARGPAAMRFQVVG